MFRKEKKTQDSARKINTLDLTLIVSPLQYYEDNIYNIDEDNTTLNMVGKPGHRDTGTYIHIYTTYINI